MIIKASAALRNDNASISEHAKQKNDAWLNQQGYRMVICGKHVAIYRKIGCTVYIYHIADTQTEYTKLFY